MAQSTMLALAKGEQDASVCQEKERVVCRDPDRRDGDANEAVL